MSSHSVAVIGTGPDPQEPTVEGFAMGYRHAEAYRTLSECSIVACADIVSENAHAFADAFNIPDRNVFEDYEIMLQEVEPDIVSVTVPPGIHESVVVDSARTEPVKAIHCEKPMSDSWSGAKRMVNECKQQGVQLTFNRQRRFGRPFTEAKRLVNDGAIGTLKRVEISWGDFFDTGAHTVDLAGMFNGDRDPIWVMAQLDYRERDVRFGMHQENQMWAQWRYENGVYGLMSTGPGTSLNDAAFVLRGDDGEIAINCEDGPMLELRQDGNREPVDVAGETIHNTGSVPDRFGVEFHQRAIEEIVTALDGSEQSQLSGDIGLNTAEILFGGYESVRQRGRIDFPLDIDDNPLEQMVESEELTPVSTGER